MDMTEFWNRIKVLCKKNGITQQELSEKLGYGNRNLEIKIARKSPLNIEDLKSISQIFNVTYEYLIDGIGEGEKAREKFTVPVVNRGETKAAGHIELPESLNQYGENLVMVYVETDSMQPILNRGDIVLCDKCGYSGEGIYALDQEKEYSVRRVFKDSGNYVIKPDNPVYPAKEIPVDSESSCILGRVHYILKKYD